MPSVVRRFSSSSRKSSTVQKSAPLSRQMRRLAVAELVVVDDRPSRPREVGHRQQVVVRAAGAAVRRDERREAGVRDRR